MLLKMRDVFLVYKFFFFYGFIFKQVIKNYLSGPRHQFKKQGYAQIILIKTIL